MRDHIHWGVAVAIIIGGFVLGGLARSLADLSATSTKGHQIIALDDPLTEGECNNRQIQKCTQACNKAKKLMIACDVNFEWQDDGTVKRTVICTCASPNAPGLTAKKKIETEDIELDDPICEEE